MSGASTPWRRQSRWRRWSTPILLDSGDPDLPVRQLGGTGRVHDWRHSRAIVERTGCPVYLAGGLRPTNVAAALQAVRPFGVDVCSGVRTDGRLDEKLLRRFMRAARGSGGS